MAQSAPSLRLVLDTNVVVAGLLWSGPPRRLIESAIEGMMVELFSSPVLLDELAHTPGYAKFNERIARSGSSVPALLAQYAALITLAILASVPRVRSSTGFPQYVAPITHHDKTKAAPNSIDIGPITA